MNRYYTITMTPSVVYCSTHARNYVIYYRACLWVFVLGKVVSWGMDVLITGGSCEVGDAGLTLTVSQKLLLLTFIVVWQLDIISVVDSNISSS